MRMTTVSERRRAVASAVRTLGSKAPPQEACASTAHGCGATRPTTRSGSLLKSALTIIDRTHPVTRLTDRAPYAYAAVANDISRLIYTAGAWQFDESRAIVPVGDIVGQAALAVVISQPCYGCWCHADRYRHDDDLDRQLMTRGLS